MTQVRWGIVGPGNIARNFADGLAGATSGTLKAIASRDADRRRDFGDCYDIASSDRHATYDALLADADIDAVYVATPHPFHAEQGLSVIRAGKALLLEKPAGLNAAEVVALTEAAAQEGVFFMEAYMYRCHPQIARLLAMLAAGTIGTVRHIRAAFGFATAVNPKGRLFDRALAGGGILDVGGYPVSAARLIAGAATGKPFAEPVSVKGAGTIGTTGVDETAYALLTFADGITAEVACAITRRMDSTLYIEGTGGSITLPTPWMPGRDAAPSNAEIHVTSNGETTIERVESPEHLFTFEAEAASRAILAGDRAAAYPAPDAADSIGTAHVLDQWRAQVDYATFAEAPGVVRVLPGTLPRGLPPIPTVAIPGIDKPVSRLVLGCDNRDTPAEGAIVWDAWMEAGGTAFDTAAVYGGGRHEAVLGQWIASRGVADEIVVIAKGAHTPYCLPQAIGVQLDQSLERLQLARTPLYILHRDNTDVPVGEFVDAMNRLIDAGRVGIWGGSNWSVARFAEARAHAEANGLTGPAALNNNLSLAVMEKPVWDGCVTSNDAETLAYLRDEDILHLSWSSQARGYFLPADLRDRLPADTAPETCFGSPANAERRIRAGTLAAEKGVSAHNIATAWVLAQSFPSLALVGPRSPGEIASTLPGLAVSLTGAERDWLNLERDDRAG